MTNVIPGNSPVCAIQVLTVDELTGVGAGNDTQTVSNVCTGIGIGATVLGIAGIFLTGPVGVTVAVVGAMSGTFAGSCSVATAIVSSD